MAIVYLALLIIGQNLVGLADLFEAIFCRRIVRIFIGMPKGAWGGPLEGKLVGVLGT